MLEGRKVLSLDIPLDIEHLVESRSSSAEEVTLDRGQSSEWIRDGSGIRDEKSFSVSSKSENFQL